MQFQYIYIISKTGGQPIRKGPEVEARIRRATEREGRRARRRRARELAPTMPKHIDGMSSDDEVTEQQNLAFKQTKGCFNKFCVIYLYYIYIRCNLSHLYSLIFLLFILILIFLYFCFRRNR